MRSDFRTLDWKIRGAAARFYGEHKSALWIGLRQTLAIQDSVRCLKSLVPQNGKVDEDVVKSHLEEVTGATGIREKVEQFRETIGKGWEEKLSGASFASLLFCFVALRLAKPEVVVETGCATGWTSALLLYALHCNRKGRLWTIDIPAQEGQFQMKWTLPEGLGPGFLVPEELRARWTLILGNARERLVPHLAAARAG